MMHCDAKLRQCSARPVAAFLRHKIKQGEEGMCFVSLVSDSTIDLRLGLGPILSLPRRC